MLACSDETRKRHALDNIFIIQIVVIDRYLPFFIFEKLNVDVVNTQLIKMTPSYSDLRIFRNTDCNKHAREYVGKIDPAFAKWLADRWHHIPVRVV
jgi:hypothetical protein